MPQQLKQFVENSKKQKEYKNFDGYQGLETQNYEKSGTETEAYEPEMDFGKHFLTFTNSNMSSEDERELQKNEDNKETGENVGEAGTAALNMSLHE